MTAVPPPQPPLHPPQPPDWQTLGGAYGTISTELQNLQNLDTVELAASINTLTRHVEQLFVRLDTVDDRLGPIARIDQSVQAMRQELRVLSGVARVDRLNASVKLYNRKVVSASHAIKPLRGVDGRPIEAFPTTYDAFASLSSRRLSGLLQQLAYTEEEVSVLDIDEKRTLLKQASGLVGILADTD